MLSVEKSTSNLENVEKRVTKMSNNLAKLVKDEVSNKLEKVQETRTQHVEDHS